MRARILTALISSAVVAIAAAAPPAPQPVEGQSAKPMAGQMAPDFTLVDQNGKTHSLKDYRGKWVVVYFYPKDQTPGCTNEACTFTTDVFKFRKAGAQVLGISVQDEASHKEFEKALAKNSQLSAEDQKAVAEHGLPFPLLADPTMATAKEYGVLAKFGPMVIASRDTFLVDPSGKIAKHYAVKDSSKDGINNHTAELLADIAALKAKGG